MGRDIAKAKPSPLCGGGCLRSRRERGRHRPFRTGLSPLPTLADARATLPRRGGRGLALLSFSLTIGAVLLGPALADDKAACTDGIAAIKAELAKNPAEAAAAKVKKALRVAEREQQEGEFDECLEAIDDAKRAMK